VASRPSPFEFEMAYQARVVADRIKFAIKNTEHVGNPCEFRREVLVLLLDALERLDALDRAFPNRSRKPKQQRNGTDLPPDEGGREVKMSTLLTEDEVARQLRVSVASRTNQFGFYSETDSRRHE
jgi:hypothetical protein